LAIADRVAEAGIEAMSMGEIDGEVKAVRAERRRRASGSLTPMCCCPACFDAGNCMR
jgi:hypothetical protein